MLLRILVGSVVLCFSNLREKNIAMYRNTFFLYCDTPSSYSVITVDIFLFLQIKTVG